MPKRRKSADHARATVSNLKAHHNDAEPTYTLTFKAEFPARKANKQKQAFLDGLIRSEGTVTVRSAGEFAGKL